MKKRLLCVLICLALLATLLPVTAGAADQTFSDMPASTHWSYRALTSAIENGLLRGSNGKLTPNDKLTRGQMAAVINRAFGAVDTADIGAFTDVPAKAWYYKDIAKAVRMGTFKGSGNKMRPEDPISRQEAFAVLARAFKLPDGKASALDRFTDKTTVSKWAVPELAAMAANGYVNGSNGKLNPLNSITRAEFAQVMYNMIRRYYNEAGVYSDKVSGNRMINAPDVILRDVTVNGDLIVGEGAANGDVWLDNVTVSGRLVIRGGGENSVHIINGSEVGSILVGKTGDGGVRVRTEEGCRVEVVVVDDGHDEIILEGRYNQVVVDTDAPVILKDTEITGLTVKAEDADVTAAGATKVDAAKLAKSAAGASLTVGSGVQVDSVISEAPDAGISGSGTVRSAEVSGDNTKVDTDGTTLHVDGASDVTQNGNPVANGATVVTGSGNLPEPHVHSWDNGTLTKAPTCTDPGVMTYRCSCGETRTESVAALGHDWDAGVVTREPTADADGEMTFTCTRCGEKKTEPISAAPFVIVLNEGEPDEEELRFATIEAAMAEAEKHPEYNEPGEDPWTEYAMINVRGSAAINNLNLPAGHRLFVQGDLALTGSMILGPSDYPNSRGMGAACIYIPMFDETSVTLNDLRLCDGANPENGAIRSVKEQDEQRMDVLAIYGARSDDGSIYEKPLFDMCGFFGEGACFEITQDLDFAKYFDGVCLNEQVENVYVHADVNFTNIDIREGRLVLDGGAGSLSVDGTKILGYGEECAVQLTDAEGYCAGDKEWITVFGDAAIRHSCDLESFRFRPLEQEAAVTVDAGVSLTAWNSFEVEENVRFVNSGSLLVKSEFRVMGSLDNQGSIRLDAQPTDDPQYWYVGRLDLREADLRNAGTLELTGEEAQPCAQIYSYNSSFFNDDTGVVRNNGNIDIAGGSVVNSGVIENNSRMFLSRGIEQWIRYGDHDPVQEQDVHSCTLLNNKDIRNRGDLTAEGVDVTNRGTITNDRRLCVAAAIQVKETYALESVSGEPENDAEWNDFWNWDFERQEDGENAYWRIVSRHGDYVMMNEASLMNFGVVENRDELRIESATLNNQRDGTINNSRQFEFSLKTVEDYLRWTDLEVEILDAVEFPLQEFINLGSFVNGALTGVGEEQSGTDAWFNMNRGIIRNQGTVTNNGNMDWYAVFYDQAADARLETYNTGGLHITGSRLDVPSGAFFRNEGYMQICDRYGADGMLCDLDGFKDFFTTWNEDGNDSNWCDFTAQVTDENGYHEAVAAQQRKPDNMKYNRLDFCDDITFTHDVTLSEFGDYWIQSKDATAWRVWDGEGNWRVCDENEEGAEPYGVRVGSTLTVASGATFTVAAGNILHVDGEWYDDYVSPCALIVNGTLRTEAEQPGPEGREWESVGCGSIEIWSFGRFENNGSVVNDGYFEVRYYDLGHWEDWQYVHEGRLGRLPECTVVNPPASTVYAAEVRTIPALNSAVASREPVFGRILIREDCVLTLTGDLTVSAPEINIEPGSGLIVEHGSTLTLPRGTHLWNDGDLSIYGDLNLVGCLENQQHMEIGAITGGEEAIVHISGELRSWGDLTVYNTGRILLEDEGRLSGRSRLRLGSVEVEAEGDASYTLSRFEDDNGLIFQVDTAGNSAVRLRGDLPAEFSELRLMRDHIDVSELNVPEGTRITLSDMWGGIRANIGSHSVVLDDGYNPEGYNSYEVEANADAVILVTHAQMVYEDDYCGTNVSVRYGDREYQLSPHIFGTTYNSPAIYVSTADPDIEYELRYNGQRLKFEKDLQPEENKTHLNRTAASPWFNASQNNTPSLELTIKLPDGPTVIFETVPVKPEWDEP